jgi:hypothetical protein
MTPQYRFSIVACARWETRYITEWLTYYRAIGFDHVYLYCNDDDPAPLYLEVLPFTLGPQPFVTFRYHPHQGQQVQMYGHFLKTSLDKTEWVSFFDIDEFLRLPPGQTIAQFMGQFDPSVDCVLFNWIFFGPNGHKTPPNGSVLENFTRRDAALHPLTKYVARASAFTGDRLFDLFDGHGFWHALVGKVATPVKEVNVLGEDMQTYYQNFPEQATAFINHTDRHDRLLATAMVHHYAFRSEQAFWERSARGLLGAFDGQSMWQRLAESDQFENYLASISRVSDISLASFWKNIELTAWGTNIVPQTSGWPFSRGKPATQSSVCEWSFAPAVERDASGAVNGKIDGTRKFHTGFETNPWWQVDLENTATIRRIKIFNTTDETASRFKDFSLAVSIDGDIWAEITRKEDGITVGNLNTAPYIWEGQTPAWGRYVRITALGENICMHLDQVEVYADNVEPAKQNSGADTTIVITSCNRHDLLEKTLKSLMRYNTYEGVREILVVEDGDADPADICARYGTRLIRVGERRGQLHAIDIAYSQVKTPYIFHC